MRIRAARREDLPALLEIYNAEVLQGTATFDLETKTPEQWEQWFEAHQGAGRLLLTAEMDGRAVGLPPCLNIGTERHMIPRQRYRFMWLQTAGGKGSLRP